MFFACQPTTATQQATHPEVCEGRLPDKTQRGLVQKTRKISDLAGPEVRNASRRRHREISSLHAWPRSHDPDVLEEWPRIFVPEAATTRQSATAAADSSATVNAKADKRP